MLILLLLVIQAVIQQAVEEHILVVVMAKAVMEVALNMEAMVTGVIMVGTETGIVGDILAMEALVLTMAVV
jgi:hypothetical protein